MRCMLRVCSEVVRWSSHDNKKYVGGATQIGGYIIRWHHNYGTTSSSNSASASVGTSIRLALASEIIIESASTHLANDVPDEVLDEDQAKDLPRPKPVSLFDDDAIRLMIETDISRHITSHGITSYIDIMGKNEVPILILTDIHTAGIIHRMRLCDCATSYQLLHAKKSILPRTC